MHNTLCARIPLVLIHARAARTRISIAVAASSGERPGNSKRSSRAVNQGLRAPLRRNDRSIFAHPCHNPPVLFRSLRQSLVFFSFLASRMRAFLVTIRCSCKIGGCVSGFSAETDIHVIPRDVPPGVDRFDSARSIDRNRKEMRYPEGWARIRERRAWHEFQ